MSRINLGLKIRELRKKKGITQEMLASVLSVSPQAVSKWESDLTYPDMSLIPALASYFEVSLDTLFDYDLFEMKKHIRAIIDTAWNSLFSDTDRYIKIIKDALSEYPGNEELISALLDAYEYDLRENKNTEHLDDMIDLSQKIITESTDFIKVCRVKEVQAAAYLEKGEYEKAKYVLSTLPSDINLKYDVMAFRLHNHEKLDNAVLAKRDHLQKLYIACYLEGDAWLEINKNRIFVTETSNVCINNAEKAYRQGLAVLSAFLYTEKEGQDMYLWDGMQTFHWAFHQRIAACRKRLNDFEGCREEVDKAYRVISSSWKDFEEKHDYYIKYYNQYLDELDLSEFKIQNSKSN